MSTIPGNNITITGSDIVGSFGNFIIRTPTTDSSDTFDTATNIQLSLYGESINSYNGNSSVITIYNNSAFKITLNPGSGNILIPESPLLILPGVVNGFVIVQTNSGSNTIYLNSIGSSSNVSDTSLINGNIIVGNVQDIASSVPLSGDATITNTGEITLANTGVIAGNYTSVDLTVDSKGRITNITNGSGGASELNSFYAYGPLTNINITGSTSYTTLTDYNTPSFDSQVYSYSNGVVTILDSGKYEISYNVQFNSNGNQGTNIGNFQSRLYLNGTTEIPGSVTQCNMARQAGTNNRSFNCKTWIYSFALNDTVELQWAELITTTQGQLTSNESTLIIKKLPSIGSFYAYGPIANINITGTTSYTTLTDYNTPSFDSQVYSYSNGVVTILDSGKYEISYNVQFNSNGNQGTNIGNFQSRLYLNGITEIPGSVTQCNMARQAGTNNRSFNSKTWIYSFSLNDTIELQWAELITTTRSQLTSNESVFTIKKI